MNRQGSPYSRPVEQHYSITEAAELVSVSRQTMSGYIKEGMVFPVYRKNHKMVRVPASSINRYLRNG
jgi:predicted site-specific integrase-resolvase